MKQYLFLYLLKILMLLDMGINSNFCIFKAELRELTVSFW